MGLLDSVFGGSDDNSKAFKRYAAEMRSRMGVYDPWVKTGNEARDTTQAEYNKIIENPNYLQDLVSKGFQMSPYQSYITDMVTKRMNMNAANSGMLNSGAAQRALQQELTGMSGQFLNDYIARGMNSYSSALGGMENLRNLGFNSLQQQDALLSQAAGARLQGDISKNAAESSFGKNLFSTVTGAGLGYLTGGAGGAFASLGFAPTNNSPISSLRPGGGSYNSGSYSY